MDIKKLLSIVDSNGVQQKTVITESVSVPTVSKTEQYFKAVNNEVLQNINEQRAQKKIEVKRVVSRVLEKLEEGKTTKDKPAVRNFVAKNAPKAGAGAHKDKKKAEKQGDIKHKKELVPMDEERTEVKDKDGNVTSWKDEGEWKKSTAKKDGRGKVTNLSDKARRETEKLSKKEKELAEGRFGKDAYERDYDSSIAGMDGSDHREFKRREMEHELGHETNNYAVAINGRTWKVFGTRNHAESVARKIQMRDPNKKVSVHETGEEVSEQLAESAYGDIKVGSPVKVYSNVLKKSVFGKVVNLKEGRAYVQYNNTKIVMGHPIETVQLKENATTAAATTVAKAAPGVAGKMASRLVPGLGLAVSGYDAYDRAKKGDYVGAALSGAAGLTSLIPGIGTAATMGLTGAQLARDYKKGTGAFAPDEPTPGQTATPAAKYPTTDAEIKAFQTANKLTPDGKIGPKTQAALDAAGIKKPAVAQTATPAPAAPGSNVAATARTVAPAASAIAQRALK